MQINNTMTRRIAASLRATVQPYADAQMPVPVREVTAGIIEKTGCDPELFNDLLGTLCLMAVERGLPVEFSRPLALAA